MKRESLFQKPESTPERRAFNGRLDAVNIFPLWESIGDLIPPEPQTDYLPALWRYGQVRPFLMEAGELLTAREAERRALILENPAARGQRRLTPTLFAAVQLVRPGEIAPVHRHKASAFRFVMESSGGYTAVSGERTTMHPGDFVLTPSWTFHDHGNPGAGPLIWLDGLDVPLVNILGAGFTELYPQPTFPVTKKDGDSGVRYGENLLPVSYRPSSPASPVINYPYRRSREALDRLYRNGPLHRCHGVKMQYINPASGGPPMPSIGAFIQLLPAAFEGAAYQSTDATIYCVVEGRGHSRIGERRFDWEPHDIFVVPSWYPVAHAAEDDAVLFSYSDRPIQQGLNLWVEREVEEGEAATPQTR